MDKNIYNELKTALGESDAQCECIEVFLRIAEQQYNDHASFNEIAKKYDVAVNSISTSEACKIARKSYIVMVHRVFEAFLIKLMSIMKTMGTYGPFEPEKEESKLKCIYKQIQDLSKHNDENYTLFQLCEYYRLIRNAQSHAPDEIEKLDKAYSNLISQMNKASSSVFLNLNAPNSFEGIGFDDFILFSRAVKKLAKTLFDGINYDVQAIALSFPVEKLKRHLNDKIRVTQIIRADLKTQYHLLKEKEDQIIEIIINILYND